MKNNDLKGIFTFRKRATLFVVSLLVTCSYYHVLSANGKDDENSIPRKAAKLDSAISAYQSADFSRAIEILLPVIKNESDSSSVRKRALWQAAKCYAGQRSFESARAAIEQLLDMQPNFEPSIDTAPPRLLRIYYQAKKEIKGNYEVERPDPGVEVMTVVHFANRSIINDDNKYLSLEKGFADIMTFSMLGKTKLKVVERDRVQWLFDEQKIESEYEMAGAVRVGKLLGVHVVVFGSFFLAQNETLILLARIVKVESGEILAFVKSEGKFKDFFDVTHGLAAKLADAITHEKIYVPRPQIPNTLDAMVSYSEGLVFLDKEKYDEAYQKFSEALQLDKDFVLASKAQERIRPLTLMAQLRN